MHSIQLNTVSRHKYNLLSLNPRNMLINFNLTILLHHHKVNLFRTFSTHQTRKKPPWKVLFFGTDHFSLFSLKALTNEYRKGELIRNLKVVTSVKEHQRNPVHIYSREESLGLHPWPVTPAQIDQGFDVGLVVSFGQLIPKSIIERFPYGILNVHASLLPRWRGAAPIIYAIANGDSTTGVTIMQIKPDKFDVGDIVSQVSVSISHDTKMPELYRELGSVGAATLIECLRELPDKLDKASPQPLNGVTFAPKVKASFACVDWKKMTSENVYDLGRALTGMYDLRTSWHSIPVKLIGIRKSEVEMKIRDLDVRPGFVEYHRTSGQLVVLCSDFKCVEIERVSVSGKKVMSATDFNNGYVRKETLECRYFK